jgi:hypothetical protein
MQITTGNLATNWPKSIHLTLFYSIPIEHIRNNRSGRPGSIASEDSVNLDELINANFTVDMDDETDLPDLADLDLDDSNDDFWKLEKV